MSGIVKNVGKKFRKSGLLGKIAIAAAIWWVGGVANAYFSGPSVGLGEAMAASTESMYLTATTGTFVAPAEVAAVTAEANAAIAATTSYAAETALQGAAATAIPDTAAVGAEVATGGSQLSADVLAGQQAANVAGTGLAAPAVSAAPAAATGMTTGQMASMMVGGQAISGAMAGYDAEKQREEEKKARESRGLMGFDFQGNYRGRPGIVASQTPSQVPQQTVEAATSVPEVGGQQVQNQMAQKTRPVDRRNLPELRKRGLVAQQQVV